MSIAQDWEKPPFARKVYYWPFGKTFLYSLILFAVIVVLVDALSGFNVLFLVFQIILLPTLTGLIVAVLFYRFATVEITPTTLRTMNDLSWRQSVPLNGIVKAELFSPLILVVKSDTSFLRLWIPTFLQDWDDFSASVRQVTPPENPLHQFLVRHGK